jgi:hypothetical protein
MGKRPYTLCEDENDWRGFVYDLDCRDSVAVKQHLQPGKTTAVRTDLETVNEARENLRTVVTSNARDFRLHTTECQRRKDNESCEDCWGLVVVPNKEFDREYALQKANVKNGILISGKRIPWKAVTYANLCVTVHRDGKIGVARFDRCPFCERACPLQNKAWYKSLPLVPSGRRPVSE